jgi:hypothetical protein
MNFYKNLSLLFVGCLIVGCSSTVSTSQEVKPSNQLNFIDLGKFYRELAVSLKDIDESVGVSFYEKVSPNQMPERLQKWISSVEQSGGRVNVEQPKGEMTSKDPFTIFSIISSIVGGAKNFADFRTNDIYKNIKGRDAVVELERNSKGEVVVGKVQFIKRQPKDSEIK